MLERIWRKGNPLTLLVRRLIATPGTYLQSKSRCERDYINESFTTSSIKWVVLIWKEKKKKKLFRKINKKKGAKLLLLSFKSSFLWKDIFIMFAKLLHLCPTLCDPTDSIPPGSPISGILRARTLEWVAISFSNAWKWKGKVKQLSHVWLLATPWTAAYQAPPMGFSRQEHWSGVPLG